MKKLVTVVALMTLASVAAADTVIPPVLPATTGLYKATQVSPGAGLVSYAVVWVGMDGPASYMSAFDGSLTGTLSQLAWANGTQGTEWLTPIGFTDPLVAAYADIDTHLLIPQASCLEAQAPVKEDIVVTDPNYAVGSFGNIALGMGTFLKGTTAGGTPGNGNIAFAIPLANQVQVTPIMLVVTTPGTAILEGVFVDNGGGAHPVNQSVATLPEIPEPTALVLLGIGALGTMIRRKRA